MHELNQNISYMVRKMWMWPISYIMISLFVIVLIVITSMSSRLGNLMHLERKMDTLSGQNIQALEDIQTLHGELKDTRSTIKRLEAKIKGQ